MARYKVTYHTRSGKQGSFYFGSGCIKEYVAHALQTKYAPETVHEDVPYAIAGLIVEQEYPEFGTDPMMITGLCDASSMGCIRHNYFSS